MTVCQLCGEDVPEDEAGIGQTLKVVHEHQHAEEMKALGMDIGRYTEYCKQRREAGGKMEENVVLQGAEEIVSAQEMLNRQLADLKIQIARGLDGYSEDVCLVVLESLKKQLEQKRDMNAGVQFVTGMMGQLQGRMQRMMTQSELPPEVTERQEQEARQRHEELEEQLGPPPKEVKLGHFMVEGEEVRLFRAPDGETTSAEEAVKRGLITQEQLDQARRMWAEKHPEEGKPEEKPLGPAEEQEEEPGLRVSPPSVVAPLPIAPISKQPDEDEGKGEAKPPKPKTPKQGKTEKRIGHAEEQETKAKEELPSGIEDQSEQQLTPPAAKKKEKKPPRPQGSKKEEVAEAQGLPKGSQPPKPPRVKEQSGTKGGPKTPPPLYAVSESELKRQSQKKRKAKAKKK